MLNFNSILELIRTFPDEQSCIDYLTQLRWKNGVVSPLMLRQKFMYVRITNTNVKIQESILMQEQILFLKALKYRYKIGLLLSIFILLTKEV